MPLAWADVSGVTHGRLTRLPPRSAYSRCFLCRASGTAIHCPLWCGAFCRPATVWVRSCCTAARQAQKEGPARVQWAKRAGVFALWCVSMVFFRVGSSPAAAPLTVGDAFRYLGGCFLNWAPRGCRRAVRRRVQRLLRNAIMVAAYYAFTALVLALAFYLDARRAFAFKNKPAEFCLAKEKHRWAVYYALVIALLIGYIMQSGGFGSSGFGMYAGF